MWSSAEPSSVVQSIRILDGQDASELRYAAAVTIWVRWTFQPACGAETSHRVEHGTLSPRPDGLQPAAAPQRAVPVRSGPDLRRLPPDRLVRRADGVVARAAGTLVSLRERRTPHLMLTQSCPTDGVHLNTLFSGVFPRLPHVRVR